MKLRKYRRVERHVCIQTLWDVANDLNSWGVHGRTLRLASNSTQVHADFARNAPVLLLSYSSTVRNYARDSGNAWSTLFALNRPYKLQQWIGLKFHSDRVGCMMTESTRRTTVKVDRYRNTTSSLVLLLERPRAKTLVRRQEYASRIYYNTKRTTHVPPCNLCVTRRYLYACARRSKSFAVLGVEYGHARRMCEIDPYIPVRRSKGDGY